MNCYVFYEKGSIETTRFWPFKWAMKMGYVSTDWVCLCSELGWFHSQGLIPILVISMAVLDP